jgi:hypothetical protein
MDLCSIEDAFPILSGHSERKGLKESKPSKEERRAARKKAKECKGPALTYLESQDPDVPDADRMAFKKMGEVAAFVSYNDAFPDISGGFEGFQIPKLTSTGCITNKEALPAYFGRGEDDEEGFMDYSGIEGDNPGYQLVPEAIPGFDAKGIEKAGSSPIPAPSASLNWKPTTPAKTTTSFAKNLPTVESSNTVKDVSRPPPQDRSTVSRESPVNNDMRDLLSKQIKELTKRLDDLEKKRPQRDTQKELLMFVGTGIFLLVSFDLVLRAAK